MSGFRLANLSGFRLVLFYKKTAIFVNHLRRGYDCTREVADERFDARFEMLMVATAFCLDATTRRTAAHALQSIPKVP